MPLKVLSADWSVYNNRKLRDTGDAGDFACSETWEADYLLMVILQAYPRFTESQIKLAIGFCCTYVGSPHPRKDFVTCVMKRLIK